MSDTSKSPAVPEAAIITDSLGRKLSLREPDFMQQARMTRLCGDDSTNLGYMYGFVWPTCWVTAIDNVATPFPATFIQLEGLMTRVGEAGVTAVLQYRKKLSDEKQENAIEAGAKN